MVQRKRIMNKKYNNQIQTQPSLLASWDSKLPTSSSPNQYSNLIKIIINITTRPRHNLRGNQSILLPHKLNLLPILRSWFFPIPIFYSFSSTPIIILQVKSRVRNRTWAFNIIAFVVVAFKTSATTPITFFLPIVIFSGDVFGAGALSIVRPIDMSFHFLPARTFWHYSIREFFFKVIGAMFFNPFLGYWGRSSRFQSTKKISELSDERHPYRRALWGQSFRISFAM